MSEFSRADSGADARNDLNLLHVQQSGVGSHGVLFCADRTGAVAARRDTRADGTHGYCLSLHGAAQHRHGTWLSSFFVNAAAENFADLVSANSAKIIRSRFNCMRCFSLAGR